MEISQTYINKQEINFNEFFGGNKLFIYSIKVFSDIVKKKL